MPSGAPHAGGPARRRPGRAQRAELGWILALALASELVLVCAARLQPAFDYNQWDNYEYYTPVIDYAHGQWLTGSVPLWNPRQHLGESLIDGGQAGLFYPPYTAAVALRRLLRLPLDDLMLVIAALHLPLCVVGFWCWLRACGVARDFAAIGALSASFGGFVSTTSTVWIFVLPVLGALAWTLYGVTRMLRSGAWRGSGALFGGLVALVAIGHPQMAVYGWLAAGLYAVSLIAAHRRWARLLALGPAFVSAGLASAPVWLPLLAATAYSDRSEAFRLADFLERGSAPGSYAGLLLPYFAPTLSPLPAPRSIVAYQGAWMLPALVAGIGIGCARIGGRGAKTLGPGLSTARVFVSALGVAVVLNVLALGGGTPLYALSYGLPFWSSFRWPFKFMLFGQAFIAVAATLALQLASCVPRRGWLLAGLALYALLTALAALHFGIARVEDWTGLAESIGVVGAAGALLALTFLHRRSGRAGLLVATLLSGIATLQFSHVVGMKRHPSRYAEYAAYGRELAPLGRVLPVSALRLPLEILPLGLYHCATAGGFESATGTHTGLVPSWYRKSLPISESGTPNLEFLAGFVSSHLLRSFGIGAVLVSRRDEPMQAQVRSAGLELVRRYPEVEVYRVGDALPRAYFASGARRMNRKRFERGLIDNADDRRTAYVEDWNPPLRIAQGEVLGSEREAGWTRLDVRAPRGGFLVIADSFHPGWRARVDGREVPIRRVNGRVMGLSVPANAQRVELVFFPSALGQGFVASAFGFAGFGLLRGWARARRRDVRPRVGP